MVDVIILSGTNPYRPIDGEACKGLLRLPSNELLIEPTIKAMQKSKYIDSIYVVGPKKRLEENLSKYDITIVSEGTEELSEGLGLVTNAKNGISEWKKNTKHPYVIFSSCDMPLVKTASIDSFINFSTQKVFYAKKENDLVIDYVHPMVHLKDDLKFYKGFGLKERLYLPFKEGKLRLGNMCLVNAETMTSKEGVVNLAYTLRKGKDHPIKTGVAIFGYFGLAKIILTTKIGFTKPYIKEFGEISIQKLIKRLHNKYDVNLDYVIANPDISADIDNENELKNIQLE